MKPERLLDTSQGGILFFYYLLEFGRTHMDFTWSDDEQALRAELRGYIAEHLAHGFTDLDYLEATALPFLVRSDDSSVARVWAAHFLGEPVPLADSEIAVIVLVHDGVDARVTWRDAGADEGGVGQARAATSRAERTALSSAPSIQAAFMLVWSPAKWTLPSTVDVARWCS
jgi:hypothetical protein